MPETTRKESLRMPDSHITAAALIRQICRQFDSGGESMRSFRARCAETALRLLAPSAADDAETMAAYQECDRDPAAFLHRVNLQEMGTSETTTPIVRARRHRDQLDAALELDQWLGDIRRRLPAPGPWVQEYGLRMPDKDLSAQPDGCVVNVWSEGKLAGQAIIVRTESNLSQLTIVEFADA